MAKAPFRGRRSSCKFCGRSKPVEINYKNVNVLQKVSSPQGKMYGRKRLGACAKCQRKLKQAVKRARFLALLRYVGR